MRSIAGDSGAAVLDFDLDELAVGFGADEDGLVLGVAGVFDGVVEQVDDDLHDRVGVEAERLDVLKVALDGKARPLGTRRHHLDDIADDAVEIAGLEDDIVCGRAGSARSPGHFQ